MSLTAASRRSTRRTRLVAAAIALPLALGTVLTGCSSGQIAQTAEKRPGVAGAQADIGRIRVVNAFITAPPSDKYAAGDTAQLEMMVTNLGPGSDRITKITLDGEQADIAASSATANSPASPPSGSAAAPSPVASTSIEVPAQGHVYLARDSGEGTIQVSMPQEAYPATLIPITITFAESGELTFKVPVASPADEVQRDDSQKYTPEHGEEGEEG